MGIMFLMYIGSPASHTVHKKPCCIGPGSGNRKPGKAGLPFLGGGVRGRPSLPTIRLYYRAGPQRILQMSDLRELRRILLLKQSDKSLEGS
jgi:hypothetical protein